MLVGWTQLHPHLTARLLPCVPVLLARLTSVAKQRCNKEIGHKSIILQSFAQGKAAWDVVCFAGCRPVLTLLGMSYLGKLKAYYRIEVERLLVLSALRQWLHVEPPVLAMPLYHLGHRH